MSASSSALVLLLLAVGMIATSDAGHPSEPTKLLVPGPNPPGCSVVAVDERPVRVILPAMHSDAGAKLSKVTCNAAEVGQDDLPARGIPGLSKGDRAAH